MARADRASIELSRLLASWSPRVNWARVKSLLDGVDVTRNSSTPGEHDWPLALHLARAPHGLLVECARRGMPLAPREDPAMPTVVAINYGCDRNLAFILESAEGSAAARKRQLRGTVWAWTGGGTDGVSYDRQRWKRMLAVLVAAGADLNEYDRWGRTPLLSALVELCTSYDPEAGWRGSAGRVRGAAFLERPLMLLKAGADPNLPLRSRSYEADGRWPIGATPLFARPYGDGRLHRALLAAGADPLVRCIRPAAWNAVEYAQVCLERLTSGTTVFTAPGSGRRVELGNEPIPDNPAAVRRVVGAMKRAATRRKRK